MKVSLPPILRLVLSFKLALIELLQIWIILHLFCLLLILQLLFIFEDHHIKNITNTTFVMDVKTNIKTETNMNSITTIETVVEIAIIPDPQKSINIQSITIAKCIIVSLTLQLILISKRISILKVLQIQNLFWTSRLTLELRLLLIILQLLRVELKLHLLLMFKRVSILELLLRQHVSFFH